MTSLDDIRSKLKQNQLAMLDLENERDELTWAYVHAQASTPEFITKTLEKIETYLADHYSFKSYNKFIALCKEHLTMAPIKGKVYRISKYGTRVSYNTILYEWCGKRITYVRVSENCDHYYEGCDYFNGFHLNDFELTRSEFSPIGWWNMKDKPVYTIVDTIEKRIKASSKNIKGFSFIEQLNSIQDEYKLIVALFDSCDSIYYYLLDEDLIEDVEAFCPHTPC